MWRIGVYFVTGRAAILGFLLVRLAYLDRACLPSLYVVYEVDLARWCVSIVLPLPLLFFERFVRWWCGDLSFCF